ncbi:MAG TPA: glycosyltransferase, partial [Ilumatobacteraceae bacterium]|nr:glycosyltransferase [Ilumatobacteraceae bacterium]
MRPAPRAQVSVLHGTNYVVPPSRLPRVVTVYDCWFLRHPELADPAVHRAGLVLRRAVRTGATVHATSHATAAAVRDLLATDAVEVIPLAAPPTRPVAVAPTMDDAPAIAGRLATRPYVLALGTIERRKNLPTLIAAFGRMDSAGSPLLVIAGADGDDRAAVDAAIGQLDASARERVVLTGRIDDATKQWLLAHARVLAYPSLDEGFGFPLLEAMAADVPIVASTAGSIPEVAADAAVLVDAA